MTLACLEHIRAPSTGKRCQTCVGPKGCGKSTYAAKLAHLAGVPFLRIDAASGLASFAVAGVEAGWRSAKLGSPISLMAEERVGNPIILIDEVDKCAQPDSAATLDQALLPLLKPGTAETWVCPFLGVQRNRSSATRPIDNYLGGSFLHW